MRARRHGLLLVGATLGIGLGFVGPSVAQDLDQIATEAGETGRYLEYGSDAEIDAGIDAVNDAGMVFIWLNSDADPELVADGTLDGVMQVSGRRYVGVAVLTQVGFNTYSEDLTNAGVAGDAAFEDFRTGQIADGLQTLAANLGGGSSGSAEGTGASSSSGSSSGSSIGWWLMGIVAAIAAFFGINWFRNYRKAKAQAAEDLRRDKDEIREQLRNNADRVIELGDRVIASGDAELTQMYDEASNTYQDVSGSVDGLADPEAVDRLDDRMDHAEWQFEAIEAKLNGQPVPPSPAEKAEAEAAEAEAAKVAAGQSPGAGHQPALGPNESVLGGVPPATTGYYPAPRRGGGMGGMLGGIILGSTMGNRSRRSRRRSGFDMGGSNRTRSSRRRRGGGSRGGGSFRRSGGSRGGGRF